MNGKAILASLLTIGVAATMLGVGTFAYFSDVETSEGNILQAGTIDIAVDGQNPWMKTYSENLADMKPCETREITFTIHNVGTNPVNVWKHLVITDEHGGENNYPDSSTGPASSEPEYEEGLVSGEYVERCHLSPYIVYDLYVDGEPIIESGQDVRVDMINCVWIYLGILKPDETMTVRQSYHLRSWPDAVEPEVTNWAQGDVMVFDIELYAEQLTGPGPIPATDTLTLVHKDPVTWEVIGSSGTLTFNTSGSTFDYTFQASGLTAGTDYSLIYYADPWPGSSGALIATFTTDDKGDIALTSGSTELNMDIPDPNDQNCPAGGKIWLVLSSDYDGTKMTAWHPTKYLFEMHLINYDDTEVL